MWDEVVDLMDISNILCIKTIDMILYVTKQTILGMHLHCVSFFHIHVTKFTQSVSLADTLQTSVPNVGAK